MIILTFDTGFDKTYITLSENSKELVRRTISSDGEKYHSAYLISNIAQILKENDLTMQSIDKIATNIGPGSFTGIRVCLTVAKVMAQQLNIPAIGISSLEILSQANSTNKKSLILMDARKNKFYSAIYEKEKELMAPQAITTEQMFEIAKEDFYIIADTKTSKILEEQNINALDFESNNLPLGEYLMILANKKQGDYPWYNLKPLYIQPPPITLTKK